MFKKILLKNNLTDYSIGIAVVFLYHLPILFLGTSGYIVIDDVLNLEFLYKHLLKINNLLFELNSTSVIPNIYSDGLKLGFIHSRFNLVNILYYLLDSFDAYLINSLIIRIIGFVSMRELLKQFYSSITSINILLLSVAFSIIPINSVYGITVIGIPIIFIAFKNLFYGKRIYLSYVLIIFYILYSTPLTYPFILAYLLAIFIINIFFRNKSSFLNYFFWGILIFISTVIISEINLIISGPSEISHRTLRNLYESGTPSFNGILYGMIKYNLFGSFHPSLLIPISFYTLIIIYFRKLKITTWIIISIIFLHRLIDLTRPFIENTIGNYFDLLKIFDIGRLTWLNPFLFFLALILIIKDISKSKYSQIIIITALTFQSIFNLIRSPEFIYNIMDNRTAGKYFYNDDFLVKNLYSFHSEPFNLNRFSALNYDQFFSVNLFKQVDSFINLPKESYRVLSYGVDPSVLLYNGFYTLDGYSSNHSKKYHLIFDQIQPNSSIKASHRLVLYNDFCRHCTKNEKNSINELNLDYDLIKSLNGHYIISAIEIKNESNLKLENIFENNYYKLFLYKIK